jgi:hypothetical protein
MRRRHHALTSYVVKDQGHAPLLRDTETIEQVAHFLAATEAAEWQPRLAYG